MRRNLLTIIVVLLVLGLFAGGGYYIYNTYFKPVETVQEAPRLVKYILPEHELYAGEKEKKKIVVCAPSGSQITLKVGYKDYKLEETSPNGDGNALFIKIIKMPSSKEEIEAIGNIKVVCTFNNESSSADGPVVIYEKRETTTALEGNVTTKAEAPKTDSTTLKAENYNGEDIYFDPTVKSTTQQPVSDQSYTTPRMVRIVSQRADTWPGDTADDVFNPDCSSLTKGTLAFVTGTSSAYDSSKKKTRFFYNLSHGRRILQETAEFVSETKGENSVTSSAAVTASGTVITFSETWHVPYNFSFTPQSYYKSSGKLYNVNAFTPTSVSFTFYNTYSAGGSCNVASSQIVSDGKWTTDSTKRTATLTMQLKKTGGFYGYSADYDSSGNLVITLKNKAQSLKGSTIVLDPGHGGKDSGALGINGTIYESNINFNTTVALKRELESRGATVYLTRSSDNYLTLEQRSAFVYRYKPDLFVSVHSNSSPSSSATIGPSVYYYKPMSQPLADSIYKKLLNCYRNCIYPGDPGKTNIERGCNFNPFAVTRMEECPSVLIEMGYVSNDDECRKLCDSNIQSKIASYTADGIEEYIKIS